MAKILRIMLLGIVLGAFPFGVVSDFRAGVPDGISYRYN